MSCGLAGQGCSLEFFSGVQAGGLSVPVLCFSSMLLVLNEVMGGITGCTGTHSLLSLYGYSNPRLLFYPLR